MTAVLKPRAKRAWNISEQEHDCHHWLGRLAMSLAIASHDLPPHLQTHVRKTVDEFLASDTASVTLARMVREEMKR